MQNICSDIDEGPEDYEWEEDTEADKIEADVSWRWEEDED